MSRALGRPTASLTHQRTAGWDLAARRKNAKKPRAPFLVEMLEFSDVPGFCKSATLEDLNAWLVSHQRSGSDIGACPAWARDARDCHRSQAAGGPAGDKRKLR